MSSLQYLELQKQFVRHLSASEKHNDYLRTFKQLFSEAINSRRRIEKITTFGQLLKVLDLRDAMSPDNILPLQIIAQTVGSEELLKNISDYNSSYEPKGHVNYYAVNNVQKEDEDPPDLVNPNLGGGVSKRKRKRIIDTIVNEIGSFWRDLARNLKIRECIIDDIDYDNTIYSVKAAQAMEAYEHIADPQRWFYVLCDALERSRRRDISRSIQEIMAMNI